MKVAENDDVLHIMEKASKNRADSGYEAVCGNYTSFAPEHKFTGLDDKPKPKKKWCSTCEKSVRNNSKYKKRRTSGKVHP